MQAQFDLAKKMIIDIKPMIIIVSNAFVRDVFKGNTNVKPGFTLNDEEKTIKEYGTPLVSSPLKDIPIFFTSMLSGQRALDLGSFDRLIWHIKYVMGKK